MEGLLGVLDLAHRIDLPLDQWWDAALEALDRALDDRVLVASCGSLAPVPVLRAIYKGKLDVRAGIDEAYGFDSETNAYLATQGPRYYWRETAKRAEPTLGARRAAALSRMTATLDIDDLVCVNCLDPSVQGVAVCLDASGGASGPLPFAGLDEVVAHLAAAFRLREFLERGSGESEAVLSADGTRVEHATGAALDERARDALCRAARSLQGITGANGVAAQDALLAQQVLVRGRWSLVHEEERDGKRFILARVNDPIAALPLLPELPMREQQVATYAALGHSLKFIAYELGLSVPTVSRTLASAQRLLGVQSRSGLVEAVFRRVGIRLAGVEADG